ncbi:hypothetical protein GCM10018790_37270 [Kitasatospora xanthocidica]|nr:hypothetical protein GCM10018790_37270 [Kitasatospora xanthocidica]
MATPLAGPVVVSTIPDRPVLRTPVETERRLNRNRLRTLPVGEGREGRVGRDGSAAGGHRAPHLPVGLRPVRGLGAERDSRDGRGRPLRLRQGEGPRRGADRQARVP